jgi:hypothetical protein
MNYKDTQSYLLSEQLMRSLGLKSKSRTVEIYHKYLEIMWEYMFDENGNHRTTYRLKPGLKFSRELKFMEGHYDDPMLMLYKMGLLNKVYLEIRLLESGLRMLDNAVVEINTYKNNQKLKELSIFRQDIDKNSEGIEELKTDIALMKKILYEVRVAK